MKFDNVLLINCIGSYFYNLVNSITNNQYGYLTLFYLTRGELLFQNLDIYEVKKKYMDNPWGYQPVSIYDENRDPLVIKEDFFSFLDNKLNIKVASIQTENNQEFNESLVKAEKTGFYNIVSVDEFFIPASKVYYKKKHNKHFLLLKKVDLKNGLIEIIDSEKAVPYHMKALEVEKAIYKSTYSKKRIFQVDCSLYRCKLDPEKIYINWKRNASSIEYIDKFKQDILEKTTNYENVEYFFRGYYYSILSKIYPYALMQYHILQDCKIPESSYAYEIAQEWKNIYNYIYFKILKNDLVGGTLAKKLDKMAKKQEQLNYLLKI